MNKQLFRKSKNDFIFKMLAHSWSRVISVAETILKKLNQKLFGSEYKNTLQTKDGIRAGWSNGSGKRESAAR